MQRVGGRTLNDVRDRPILEVRCERCERVGRFETRDLIKRNGADAALPDVRHELAADCPNRNADVYHRCDPFYPALG